jgi:DNA-binding NarL/FixJ family response regulator
MACQLMSAALQRSRPRRLAVVGRAVDSAEIWKILREYEADVAVISAHLGDGPIAGFAVARELSASHRSTKVIMLLDTIEGALVVEAFRSGASGVICRDQTFEMLCKCIHVVHLGQIWASAEALRFVVNALSQSPPISAVYHQSAARSVSLTQREEGVVNLVAQGFTNRDISRQLSLSENTVRNYLFRIFNKLGTSNRLELALYSINRQDSGSQQTGRVASVVQYANDKD